MILMSLILALADVFIISQLSFWGATPLLLAVMLYVFRFQASSAELLAAATVYGFTVSVFAGPRAGLITMSALFLASAVSIGLHRTIVHSQLRFRLKRVDSLVIAGTFSAVFWACSSLFFLSSLDIVNVAILSLLGFASTLILMLATDLITRKVT